jgi:hypothetical protein
MSSTESSNHPVNFWADLEGSDDEVDDVPVEVTFDSACAATIPFGKKHRGETIGALVRTRSGRSYMRYLLDWDKLYADLRINIEFVMAAYNAVTIGSN